MTTARDQVIDSLDRAQRCYKRTLDELHQDRREAVGWFIHHVTTAVLLEQLRRADPAAADRLLPWLFAEDGGIFGDEYAGVLVTQWQEQLALGKPMDPIGPDEERTA